MTSQVREVSDGDPSDVHSICLNIFYAYLLDLFQRENGGRAYKCQLCPTIYNSTKEIQQHIGAVHEGKKEHSCDFCQMKFSYLRSMKKHQDSKRCRKPENVSSENVGYVKITVIHQHFSKIQK